MKYLVLLILSVAIGLGAVYYYRNGDLFKNTPQTNTVPKPTNTPTPTLFSTKNPPSESLTGTLDSLTGTVTWEPREATQSSPINSRAVIKQGDYIETGSDGTVAVTFPKASLVTMQQDSYLQITQTLPANIVFSQNKGTITYERVGKIPVSIRVLSLLIDLDEASQMRVTVGEETEEVTVTAEQGSGITAYNNADFETVKLTLHEGEELTFDNQLRESNIE